MKAFLPITLILVAAIAFSALVSACAGSLTSGQDAASALRVQGFSDLQPRGRDVLFVELRGCGRDDRARYEFRARNPAGREVTVYVCEGWPFKGATVRYP